MQTLKLTIEEENFEYNNFLSDEKGLLIKH